VLAVLATGAGSDAEFRVVSAVLTLFAAIYVILLELEVLRSGSEVLCEESVRVASSVAAYECPEKNIIPTTRKKIALKKTK
jgi:hypothetical protein